LTLTLHDTSDWSREQFDWPNVIGAIRTYTDRFPEDASVESVIRDVMHGAMRLWVVRDAAGATVAAVLVTLGTVEATGWKRASVVGFGGVRGIEALPMLPVIEAWARSQGADEIEAVGRPGWRKLLGGLGYREAAVILRKRLS
jgi:hypothetical protein